MRKEYFLLGVFIITLLAAGFWIYRIANEYQKAEQEYEQLQEYIKIEKNTEDPERIGHETQEGKTEKNQRETVTVDFHSLKKINSDVVAWLRIPGVLEYPVVRGQDNSYYLSHTVQKTYNITGSIFLDYRNEADFSDSKSIIYGHNMKDGSMFHVLRNYRNIEFFQKYREMEVYLPDGRVLNYEITACEEVTANSDVYQLTQESRECNERNEIILSTCSAREQIRIIVRAELN